MKSVLHIGLIAPGYSNIGLMKAFFANGFSEYTLFDFQLQMFTFDKVIMRQMLIKEAERLKPDMIFMQIQSSDILDTSTFKRLSEISFTVNYTFDIRTPEQTEWLYNIVPVLGLICFSNQRDVEECNRRGYSNVMVLQSSVDMDIYTPGNEQRSGIVFIGNNFENTSHSFPLSSERAEMVKFLKNKFGDYFKVYGTNWEGAAMLKQKDEISVLQSAKIAINHNNFDEDSYTSDRIWRIMSTGTMCLTKYFKGLEKWFIDGDRLDWWKTFDELKLKIDYYLSRPNETYQMGLRGMVEVRKNHTWSARIKEMLYKVDSVREIWVFDTKSTFKNNCVKYGAHVIDGVIPGPFDEKFNGRTCDCGKLIYYWQECGCQLQEWQLRAQENI